MLSPDNFAGEGTQGFNRYAYVTNNPLKYTDPNGEDPLLIAMAIGGTINVLMNWNSMFNGDGNFQFNNFVSTFAQGALIGLISGVTGGAAISAVGALPGAAAAMSATAGIQWGLAQGIISGSVAGATSGMLTAVFQGKSAMQVIGAAGQGFVMGGFIGGIMGGAQNALNTLGTGRNIWSGKYGKTTKMSLRYYASTGNDIDYSQQYDYSFFDQGQIVNGSTKNVGFIRRGEGRAAPKRAR